MCTKGRRSWTTLEAVFVLDFSSYPTSSVRPKGGRTDGERRRRQGGPRLGSLRWRAAVCCARTSPRPHFFNRSPERRPEEVFGLGVILTSMQSPCCGQSVFGVAQHADTAHTHLSCASPAPPTFWYLLSAVDVRLLDRVLCTHKLSSSPPTGATGPDWP